MKRFLLLCLLALAGCDARLGPDEGPTRIRFVNAVPDALSNLQFTLPDGPSASLAQGASSAYAEVTPRRYALQIRDESNVWNVAGDIEIAEGLYQSLIAFGTADNESAVLVADEASRPASGNMAVRIIHLGALITASIDAHLIAEGQDVEPNRPVIGPLAYPSNPGYLSVLARTARVVVTEAGTAVELFRSEPLQFVAGDLYTVIITNDDEGAITIIRMRDGV